MLTPRRSDFLQIFHSRKALRKTPPGKSPHERVRIRSLQVCAWNFSGATDRIKTRKKTGGENFHTMKKSMPWTCKYLIPKAEQTEIIMLNNYKTISK